MKKILMQINSMSHDGQCLVLFLIMLPFLVVFYFTGNNLVILIPCIAFYLVVWFIFYLNAQILYKEKRYIKFCFLITFMIFYALIGLLVFGYGSWLMLF